MNSTHPPLHELNPTGRFSDRVRDYVRFRPSYPPEAIDELLGGLGDPAALRAADVGAGTGIFSRLLADRGVQVIAIEPNAAMRGAAGPHPRVDYREGTAERTGLPDAGVDLVVAAQAFHWFRPREALAEFRRILRPAGRLGLLWNLRDESDAFTAGYTAAIREVTGVEPAEMRPFDAGLISAGGLFRPARRFESRFAQRLDETAVLGRAASASYVPKSGPGWEQLAARLRELTNRHAAADGLVTMRYVTRLYTARPA